MKYDQIYMFVVAPFRLQAKVMQVAIDQVKILKHTVFFIQKNHFNINRITVFFTWNISQCKFYDLMHIQ